MTRVIIAGSRNFNDYDLLCKECDGVLHGLNPADVEIVSGGCTGADALGERYAHERGYGLSIFEANWKKFGKSAGPRRNALMGVYAQQADDGVLMAFPVGESKGTRNMISTAEFYGLEVYVFESN